MIFKSKQSELHSRYYWALVTVCLIIGVPVAFWIYIEISNNVTGRTRIPVYLLLIPLMILMVLARWVDAKILKAAPQLVRERDRAALASALGYDPVSGQRAASAAPTGPSTAGYAQPVAPAVGTNAHGAQYGQYGAQHGQYGAPAGGTQPDGGAPSSASYGY